MEVNKNDVAVFISEGISGILKKAKKEFRINMDLGQAGVDAVVQDMVTLIWKEIRNARLMPAPYVSPSSSPAPRRNRSSSCDATSLAADGTGSGKRPRSASTSTRETTPVAGSPRPKKKRSGVIIREPTRSSPKPKIIKVDNDPPTAVPPPATTAIGVPAFVADDPSSDRDDPGFDDAPLQDHAPVAVKLHSPVKPATPENQAEVAPATPKNQAEVALEAIKAQQNSKIMLSGKSSRGFTFTLTNDAEAVIAYKIDGAPQYLQIDPAKGVITENAEVKITVRIEKEEYPENLPLNDVLSIRWRITPVEDVEKYNDIWFQQQGFICQKIIPVVYI